MARGAPIHQKSSSVSHNQGRLAIGSGSRRRPRGNPRGGRSARRRHLCHTIRGVWLQIQQVCFSGRGPQRWRVEKKEGACARRRTDASDPSGGWGPNSSDPPPQSWQGLTFFLKSDALSSMSRWGRTLLGMSVKTGGGPHAPGGWGSEKLRPPPPKMVPKQNGTVLAQHNRAAAW